MMQQRLGVAEQLERSGSRTIRDFMPEQHREFYRQLPFLLVGAVDSSGAPWATLLSGEPGFVASPDARTLRIAARPDADDPVGAALAAGSPVGMLGIELHTRRRNRVNGAVTALDRAGFTVSVGHAFGNCPQYIQTRALAPLGRSRSQSPGPIERAGGLDADAAAVIAAADTFFVTSYVDVDGQESRRAVDTSHRGGRPGFIRIDGNVLTIPDFAGNQYFNTLGNLLLNPRAGLLFVDFRSGDLLQLTGSTELVFDGAELASFQGAERLWRLKVERLVRRRAAIELRWTFGEFSPNSLMTGSWEEAAARQSAEALRHKWRPFRVARIVKESTSITSFHLEPEDGAGLPLFRAGQHLPIRLRPSPSGPAVIRTYTLSVAPADAVYRISVKRDGAASQYLHDRIAVGDRIEARAPAGEFTVDADAARPLALVSAGVGITPMLAMLRHVVFEGLRTRRLRQTWFLHGARTQAERAFDKELGELVQLGQGLIRVVRALSQPEASAVQGVDYELPGRFDTELLKTVLPLEDCDFYLCGPASFTQGLYDGLRGLQVGDERIHAEAFGPSTLVRQVAPGLQAALAPAATEPVQVVFAQSAKEARWTPGSGTLLDLAEASGLAPEFSCRGGTCGTCRARILDGQLTYLKRPTAALDPGTGLVCCAVPAHGAGDRLVLDL
ncbi:MAG TPA: pyridoxamine 5'-phosphate oxidase family protein [Pseudomonadota bacterium]|nr:pyridoxamine 5'-phosphate oxidase family protein [Pseudomonadota bacterium]